MPPRCCLRAGISGGGAVPRKIAAAIETACGPLSRTMAIAPSPKAVEIAAMVSFIRSSRGAAHRRRLRRWCGGLRGVTLFVVMICAQAHALYPETKRVEVRDNYHGV